jgi:hypothetical protein
MPLHTVAFELVPPNAADGKERALEEAAKVARYAGAHGVRLGHIMMPGLIAEEDDRPIPMEPKIDVVDFWSTIAPELPGMHGLCTQVSAFLGEEELTRRVEALLGAGMDGIIFVGVPRTMQDGEGSGVAPTDALEIYAGRVPNRGVIVIPTREGEHGRLGFKCRRGATFGMTQLLYSDAIVAFLRDFAARTPHRPEILLSFGYVTKFENRVGLIRWLIQDPGNPAVAEEQAFVARLSDSDQATKRQLLVDLYRRVVDGVSDLGFPLGLHLEAPYGPAEAAFETFAAMLDYWDPTDPNRSSL